MDTIKLPVAELKPALLGLSKVINKRPTLPVLGMVKIERTPDGWVALTGTDLDTFVTVRMEQPAEGPPLTLLIPLDGLQTTVKNCGKHESIEVQPLNNERVTIRTPVAGNWSENHCDTAPLSEFPAIPKFHGDLVPIPDSVRGALHEAFACASTDETRLILNGAYLDVSKKDCHCVVGTDGRHLYSSNSFSLPMKESVIIPVHRFLSWPEFSKDGEWRLKSGPNTENKEHRHLQLNTRRWRFITRHIDGNYPQWRQVLPNSKDAKTIVEFGNPEMVIQAMQRMPDHDSQYHTIGLAVEKGSVLLLGKGNKEDTEWFSVPLPNIQASGDDVRLYTNREQVAKALEFGLTRLEIIDPLSPLRLSHEGRQMIVMPVNIQGPPQTSATAPAPTSSETAESNGMGEAGTVASEPNTPPAAPTPTAADNTPAAPPQGEPPMSEQPKEAITHHGKEASSRSKYTEGGYSVEMLIDQALTGVEELQEAFDTNVQSLNSLRATVRILQREYKASTKEVESLKKTLKGLQSVKL